MAPKKENVWARDGDTWCCFAGFGITLHVSDRPLANHNYLWRVEDMNTPPFGLSGQAANFMQAKKFAEMAVAHAESLRAEIGKCT